MSNDRGRTWRTPPDSVPPPADDGVPDDGGRYLTPVVLGRGGMGTVFSVTDTRFDRVVALKLLHPGTTGVGRRRFLDEARITARLDHPGVVAVHDLGDGPDGRPYLTMQRVDGLTLRQLLAWAGTPRALPVRRLLDILRSVAETLAFAHDRRIVHRDLKPENIMVGRFGDVRVMDWGIAVDLDAPRAPGSDERPYDPLRTADGEVTGTPAYLSPEQASGEPVGPAADVYALGALLVELVSGRPLRRHADPAMMIVAALRPVRLPDAFPDGLADLARKTLSLEPADRPTADAFALALSAWLQGAERADLARARLTEARAAFAQVRDTLAREDALTAEVRVEREPSDLAVRWAREDERAALALARTLQDADVDRLLGLAAAHAPELDEVHSTIAEIARIRCERAEADGDLLQAARHEVLVRRHDRGELRPWLEGDGRLTLHTDPSGVPVVARRLVERERRLVPEDPIPLGTTPLDAVRLGRGSWVLDVGGTTVPVFLDRNDRWDQVPPGETAPIVLPLPAVAEDEVYVPAGPFLSGGDPAARFPRPRAKVWVDGFVLRRHPVTHGEYLWFLTERQSAGVDIEGWIPRAESVGGELGPRHYPTRDGRLCLPEDDWDRMPVFFVSRYAAEAFAAWESARTGLPWRLPTFAEREKAARGVDGRKYPWGSGLHPSWSNTGASFPEPQPVPIDDFRLDTSVYGARGMAGNVSDWLFDGHEHAMAQPARAELASPPEVYGAFAGGSWNSGGVYARCANVGRYAPTIRMSSLGFRLARSL